MYAQQPAIEVGISQNQAKQHLVCQMGLLTLHPPKKKKKSLLFSNIKDVNCYN